MKLNIANNFLQKTSFRVLTESSRKRIEKFAAQSGEVTQMTVYGIQNYKIRLDSAMVVLPVSIIPFLKLSSINIIWMKYVSNFTNQIYFLAPKVKLSNNDWWVFSKFR